MKEVLHNKRIIPMINIMKKNNLNKYAVIDVLNIYVYGSKFIQRLDDYIKKDGERTEYYGVIFSEEYDSDDEGYFGDNRVLFYSGDDDDVFDIVDYNELYTYLSIACEFYIKRHKSEEEIVKKKLMLFKKVYEIE